MTEDDDDDDDDTDDDEVDEDDAETVSGVDKLFNESTGEEDCMIDLK